MKILLRSTTPRCPRLLPAVLCALGLAVLPGRARAVYVLTVSEVDGNVQVSGSGSLNTAALNPGDNAFFDPQLDPSFAELLSGTPGSGGLRFGGIAGPASFGSGSSVVADGGADSYVGVIGGLNVLVVPLGYVSGTALKTSGAYQNATFATLGLDPGTYVYNWGTGANADSLTINAAAPAAPEPSTWALLGVGAVGGLLAGRRRKLRTP